MARRPLDSKLLSGPGRTAFVPGPELFLTARIAVACALLLAAHPALAQTRTGAGRAAPPGVDDKGYTSALVLEPSSGQVLFEDNADTPVPTASMVKMMTCLIVMEEIRDGRLTLDTPVTVSARSSTMGGSQIYLMEGQTFPVKTLLAATMVQSANDAAVALAEKVAGSTEAFAARMNQRGRSLGLSHSTFYDPHGLPSREKKDNVMSAHDLATLGIELMKHPLMREFAAMETMPFSNGTFTSGMTNPNHLLREYDGAYGIKTGFTVGAGFSVTAAAKRGDMDLVTVVTGAKQSNGPMSSFAIAGRLLDRAFAENTYVSLAKQGAVVGQTAVEGGFPSTIDAVAGADAGAVIPRGEERRLRLQFVSADPKAPVAAGQEIGTVVVRVGNREIARLPALARTASPVRPWWRFWSFKGR
jgi:D-alanyl-D-alanine carboxypeptidase (penicillin-binding protein 5/6)